MASPGMGCRVINGCVHIEIQNMYIHTSIYVCIYLYFALFLYACIHDLDVC